MGGEIFGIRSSLAAVAAAGTVLAVVSQLRGNDHAIAIVKAGLAVGAGILLYTQSMLSHELRRKINSMSVNFLQVAFAVVGTAFTILEIHTTFNVAHTATSAAEAVTKFLFIAYLYSTTQSKAANAYDTNPDAKHTQWLRIVLDPVNRTIALLLAATYVTSVFLARANSGGVINTFWWVLFWFALATYGYCFMLVFRSAMGSEPEQDAKGGFNVTKVTRVHSRRVNEMINGLILAIPVILVLMTFLVQLHGNQAGEDQHDGSNFAKYGTLGFGALLWIVLVWAVNHFIGFKSYVINQNSVERVEEDTDAKWSFAGVVAAGLALLVGNMFIASGGADTDDDVQTRAYLVIGVLLTALVIKLDIFRVHSLVFGLFTMSDLGDYNHLAGKGDITQNDYKDHVGSVYYWVSVLAVALGTVVGTNLISKGMAGEASKVYLQYLIPVLLLCAIVISAVSLIYRMRSGSSDPSKRDGKGFFQVTHNSCHDSLGVFLLFALMGVHWGISPNLKEDGGYNVDKGYAIIYSLLGGAAFSILLTWWYRRRATTPANKKSVPVSNGEVSLYNSATDAASGIKGYLFPGGYGTKFTIVTVIALGSLFLGFFLWISTNDKGMVGSSYAYRTSRLLPGTNNRGTVQSTFAMMILLTLIWFALQFQDIAIDLYTGYLIAKVGRTGAGNDGEFASKYLFPDLGMDGAAVASEESRTNLVAAIRYGLKAAIYAYLGLLAFDPAGSKESTIYASTILGLMLAYEQFVVRANDDTAETASLLIATRIVPGKRVNSGTRSGGRGSYTPMEVIAEEFSDDGDAEDPVAAARLADDGLSNT